MLADNDRSKTGKQSHDSKNGVELLLMSLHGWINFWWVPDLVVLLAKVM